MNYIYWLSQIQYQEQSLVGDKLYILSQLLQHEYPILPGFVLSNNLWQQFRANAGTELSKLLAENFADNYQTLQSIANRGCQIVNQASFSPQWQTEIFQTAQQLNSATLILKPIITVSYERQNITNNLWRSHTCNNHPEALSTAIKRVWSELFSAHSLLYWQKLGISVEQIKLSILIRPLRNAWVSGIVEVRDEMIQIKANWGLEHSLSQGDVEPDRYGARSRN